MDNPLCPICHAEMLRDEDNVLSDYIDFYCEQKDHNCGQRVSRDTKKTDCIKIRFIESNGEKFYVKLSVSAGYTEVWKHDGLKRNKINEIIPIDCDIDTLKNKVKTYITFA